MNNLPKDFVKSEEYCVIEPGLTKFNKDQIISHKDLMSLNDISEVKVIPPAVDFNAIAAAFVPSVFSRTIVWLAPSVA